MWEMTRERIRLRQIAIFGTSRQDAKNARRNARALVRIKPKVEVCRFSYISLSEPHNERWLWWSRIFEYEIVLNALQSLGAGSNSTVHNTCWGFQGCHVDFKEELEARYLTTNSDIQSSSLSNTCVYNVSHKPPENWQGIFDFVINVSTVEEIPGAHLEVVENLLQMVRVGGYLIVTFDVPGMQLEAVEDLVGYRIKTEGIPVSGKNSPSPSSEAESLRAGCLILRRVA